MAKILSKIEDKLCQAMYRFVEEHFYGIKESIKELGFDSKKDMLSKIKSNPQDAAWALMELCTWGMNKDYTSSDLLCDTFNRDGSIVEVFKIKHKGRCYYCTIEWDCEKKEYVIHRVKQKTVNVLKWVNI